MGLSINEIHDVGEIAGKPWQRARLVMATGEPADQSPFHLLAEYWFMPPGGFPIHSHKGTQTVAFVLDGAVKHEDTAVGLLVAGDVGFMPAGSGALHSEMPGTDGVHLLQLWLTLPDEPRSTAIAFSSVHGADAGVHREPGVEARVYAGAMGTVNMPFASAWPLTLIDLWLERGAVVHVPLTTAHRSFAYVMDGALKLGAFMTETSAPSVAWVRRGGNEDEPQQDVLRIEATLASRLILYSSPDITAA